MTIVENVTIYKCDFCKKELKRKHAMVKHETWCLNNPNNSKPCFGCVHLEQIERDVWFENVHYGEYGYEGDYKKVNVFSCTKLDKLMYPFKIERANLADKYPSTYEDQEAMPNQCDDLETNHQNLPF